MNLGVLILVAIPLAVYLLVLVFSARDFSAAGTHDAHAEPASHDALEAADQTRTDQAVIETPDQTIESAQDSAHEQNAPTPVADQTLTAEPGTTVTAVGMIAQTQTLSPDEPSSPVESSVLAQASPTENAMTEAQTPPSAITEQPADSADSSEPVPSPESQTASPPTTAQPTGATPPSGETSQVTENKGPQPVLSGQPLILPDDAPKYAFDYSGRLWVEKKRRGFFRQLRRPQLPPEDPENKSKR